MMQSELQHSGTGAAARAQDAPRAKRGLGAEAEKLLRKKQVFAALVCLALLVVMLPRTALAADISGAVTASVTWNDGDVIASAVTITGGTESAPVVITVNGTVTVKATISVSSGYVQFTGGGKLLRDGAFVSDNMLSVSSANITLEDITIDGGSVSGSGFGLDISGTSNVVINEGTVICNHVRSTSRGSALRVNSGTVHITMNGGEIKSNSQPSYGTIYLDNGSNRDACTFTMNGGSITGNASTGDSITYGGGAFYVRYATFTMNGGTISGNSVSLVSGSGKGGAIYCSSFGKLILNGGVIRDNTASIGNGIFFSSRTNANAEMYIGGDALISNNVIYLDNSGAVKYPYITSPIKNQLPLVTAVFSEDRVLAEGTAAYTLTEADMAKVSIEESGGTSYYAKLDPLNNQLLMTATDPRYTTYYNVSYYGNGGTGSVSDNNNYTDGQTVTVKANGFARTGYGFNGWNTSANGGGTAYAAGDSFNITEDTALFAQWRDERHDITGLTLSTQAPVLDVPIVATVTPAGATATYQWYRSRVYTTNPDEGMSLPGAIRASYTPLEADVGRFIYCVAVGEGEYHGTKIAAPENAVAAAAPVSIAGVGMTATTTESSYYVNGTNGAAGSVTRTEPAGGWNAKLQYANGAYTLTLKDLSVIADTVPGGIKSNVPLTLHLDGLTNEIFIPGSAADGTAAIDVNGDLTLSAASALPMLQAYGYAGDGVHVSGDITVEGSVQLLSAFTRKAGCCGIYAGGDLLTETGSDLVWGGCEENSNADSRGVKVDGSVTVNGKRFNAGGANGIGLEAGGSIAVRSGEFTCDGAAQALNKQPDLSAHPAYIYSLDNEASYLPMPYNYLAAHTYVKICNAPSAVIGNVTVSGTVNTAITPVNATVTLLDEWFGSDIAAGHDVTSWFTNIPAGITAALAADVYAIGDTATVTFSGTPTEVRAAAMAVTIPADKLGRGMALTVSANADAKWDIAAPGTVATPTFDPPAGSYTSAQNVTLACATSDAMIRYTTDGGGPTEASPLYSAPITVSASTTIKAKAFKSGMTPSAVASAAYTITPRLTYTVTYHANGGTGSMLPGTAAQGTPFVLPASVFTEPANKRFKEWAIGAADSATRVAAGGSYTFSADTTVYAIWENANTPSLSASPASLSFGSVQTGYGQIAAQEVTITNISSNSVGFDLLTLEHYTLTPLEGFTGRTAILPVGGTAKFSVRPNAALPAGNYGTTLGIVARDSTMLDIPISFTVYASGGSGSGYPMAGGGYTGNTYQGGVTVSAKGELVCTVQADCKKCASVSVDDVQLVIGKDCTVECGSTIVTILPAYLATLKDGAHTLRVQFTDGRYDTTFTTPISSTLAAMAVPNVPATGGPAGGVPLWAALALTAALGAAHRRRRA